MGVTEKECVLRERENMCVYVWMREGESVCESVCVRERERDRL